MPDAGEIKAKVSIEYDGSGIDAAKKDLESLADIVGGGLTESTGSANDALSSLDEQMAKSADSTSALVSSVGALAKPMQSSGDAITTVSESLGEQQAAIESAGSAFESIQRPIASTTSLLEDASPPMLAIAKNAESMQMQISPVSDGFAQMGESLSQSVPLLPQFASSLHAVSAEFDPREFGLNNFNENMAVFQDAMSNPYPFQMINQHLAETGQTWDDFSSSIGDNNAAFLDQMAAMPVASEKAFGSMSSGAQGAGQSFYEAAGQTEAFSKTWNDMATSVGEVGQAGGLGTMIMGPEESWSKLNDNMATTDEWFNKFGGVTNAKYGPEIPAVPEAQSTLGEMFGNAMQGFDSFMRPIMYAQMAAQMIGQVSTGIYNAAALAEGPAAHSIGTFTGAIDVLGQHSQQAAQQFSESFGKGVMPAIDAINNMASSTSGNDFWSNLGGALGNEGSLLVSLGQIAGGGLAELPTLGFGSTNQVGNDWIQTGWQGLQNLWANVMGNPEPYPTPGTPGTQVDTTQTQLIQSVQLMTAQANDPQYLAAQAYLQSQAGYATQGQATYDVSHTSGKSAFDYTPQSYQNSMIGYALANGVSVPGLSGVDLNKAYFGQMLANLPPEYTAGCFPAGTPVLLPDGTEKAIETMQIGEQVLAHDGTKQVATTILALLKPPPRRVYTLIFSDGRTLTLTDSHPISSAQGWKSLSPDATKKENPDLAVTALQAGDLIHTVGGTCTLLSIQPREIVQVYNITVGEPHTFYASGVLVHNKALGSQVMQNVANTQVPQTDMKNSNLIQSMMSNFSSADLTHTFTASVSWVGQNLSNTFTGAASWVGQGLANTFSGVASWIGQGLSNTFSGVANWIGQGLSNTFSGVASWVGQNLSNAFNAVASWVGQGLTNTFQGVADWVGQGLEHTFTAVANWIGQNLTQTFSAPTVPGFATGVQGFVGGMAVVGESGPELVYLPQGANVYPQSSMRGFSGLNMGDSGPLSITINHTTTLDGKVVAQETIPYIAPLLRSVRGIRQ